MGINELKVTELDSGINLWKPDDDALHSPDVVKQAESCEVLVGLPVGECGGVKMAVGAIRALIDKTGGPIYGNHAPTHGADSTQEFEQLGAKFDQSPDSVPLGMPYFISAHGAAPAVSRQAKERGLNVYDLTCPLVHKTYQAIRRASEQDDPHVAYISFGKPDHPERVGAAGVAEELEIPFAAIGNKQDADQLLDGLDGRETVVVVGQTTNNSDEAGELAKYLSVQGGERGINVKREGAHDVCHTVSDRQRSTRLIVQQGVGALVVVGSVNSKNTKSLALVGVQEAKALGSKLDIFLANSWTQLPEISGKVGVVSGASTRQENVQGVISRLNPAQPVTIIGVDTDKDIVFKPIDQQARGLLA